MIDGTKRLVPNLQLLIRLFPQRYFCQKVTALLSTITEILCYSAGCLFSLAVFFVQPMIHIHSGLAEYEVSVEYKFALFGLFQASCGRKSVTQKDMSYINILNVDKILLLDMKARNMGILGFFSIVS